MGRLGIISARGPLPLQLAQAARDKGEDPFIISLKGQCDCSFNGFERFSFRLARSGQSQAI